ncbi:putative DNA-binding transcriptional regulator YafY [Actinoalloteichus hoggarensis]|uniref:HTH domain protein n=1 Tax=Actinoalloteichus hoggarensis TaxID=1470176 RepID=A0A221W9L2_9PSEU|nr:WYL domain-containing protein [Actinoalloteichus hoggarensis]ASO22738.1 HTH domain protein [Actinoalloteichus hoggarensis]MBB5924120.1 putative DNA-binding transcriptional regulator YafY [Actinoalloteichus hoggarensis]
MRADRLIAALLLLQVRGRVTAAELAEELEVSVATARRDLDALSAAGVPVYSQPGRGGGWSLIGGARTDLSGLTAPEARALFLLLGPATATTPELRTAVRKLLRALPEGFRDEAGAAADTVLVDPTRWGTPRSVRPVLVTMLQAAVVDRRKVRLTYAGRGRERTDRLVDPWGLVDKNGVWYLMAGTDRGRRTFRVDRILDAVTTEVPAERPHDLALSAIWDQVVDEVERRRSLVSTAAIVDVELLPALRGQFGLHCAVGDRVDDRRVRVRLAAPTAEMIAIELAGWGARVQVTESAAVRAELARIGAELTETCRPVRPRPPSG